MVTRSFALKILLTNTTISICDKDLGRKGTILTVKKNNDSYIIKNIKDKKNARPWLFIKHY